MDYYHINRNIRISFLVRIIIINHLILFLCLKYSWADNVITKGTTVTINIGTTVMTLQNLIIEDGGSLNVEGKLILKNNFVNQNTIENLGSGTIEFSGTTIQSISGQNEIGKLVDNNPAGINIMGNTLINRELSLISGFIRIGNSSLTLGKMSTISGRPSVSAMVVATNSGELRKSFMGAENFTFPVGDESGTGKYTPVTMNFTRGNFDIDNYIGVSLKSAALPEYSGKSLNRVWSLTYKGISGYYYDAAFQYVPEDSNVNENELVCVKIAPKSMEFYNSSNTKLHQLTANGLSSFGIFTGIVNSDHTVNQSNLLTSEFRCFPNPFSHVINIELQNSKNEEINVEIYNLLGQHIKTLFKGIYGGNLKLKWDATNESGQQIVPGAYFVKINGQSNQIIYENLRMR